jgi:hypothetical protein
MIPSRRQFLRGALGSAVTLPLLSVMGGRARAVPPAFPKRLLIFFTPHGIVRKDWRVSGSETEFTIDGIPAPLAVHRDKLLFLQNIDMHSAEYGPGDTHQEAMGALLSGTGLLADPLGSGGKRMDTYEPVGWGGGISLDQYLARGMGAVTRFPSLESGIIVDFNQVGGRINYLDANKPIAPMNDPALVFDRMFADLGADPIGVARIRAERKSVLDAVRKQFARLEGKLGKDDAAKLQSHAAAIRDLEVRLTTPGATLGGACMKPGRPSVAPMDVNVYPTIGKMQMDLMVMAFACDLTRIGTIMWSHAGPSPSSPWLGISETHHQLSHAGDLDADAQTKLSRLKSWYAQQFAYLLDAMKKVPEGEGTLLDNTVVWWCSELSIGNSHSHQDMPFVLAGSCGGHFKTGRLVSYPRLDGKGRTHNDLLVSLAQAMGHTDVKTFGNPTYCTGGPLSGLTV